MTTGARAVGGLPATRWRRTEDRSTLSYAERRLWFLDQLHPGSTGYSLPYVFRVSGPLDLPALRGAITGLHRRHEVLRSTYRAEAGEPKRVITAPGEVTPVLTVVDSTGDESRARELLERDHRTPFDLATEHPVRWTLIRLAADDHLLALTVHHIAFDEWSGYVLAEDFAALYDAAVAGVPPVLSPLVFDYADHAARERSTGSIAYWERELDGVDKVDLPLDHARPPVWRPEGGSVAIEVPAELAAKLAVLGRSAGASRFMTMLATFTGLLARLSGQADICVGTPMSCRTDEETHAMVGLFANTVVIRGKVRRDTTFRDLLGETATTTLAAMEHQDVPFDLLVERLGPDRDLSRNPLFQTMFVLEEGSGGSFEADGLRFEEIPIPPSAAKVDLTLALWDDENGGLSGHFEYATALFDRSTIERIARLFLRLAENAVAEPDRRLFDLPLSSARQQREEMGYLPARAEDVSTVALVARQVEWRPDAIAIEEGLTYRAVAQEADSLAHALTQTGITRGSVVGVCVERGPRLGPALLGVMAAGATVLWLDPAQPVERSRELVADAGARSVVANCVLGEVGVPVLDVEADRPPAPREYLATARIDQSDTAYIAYTSGSTGRAKGVRISHGALSEHLQVISAEYRITERSRVALIAALGFDVSLEQILTALVSGARVVPLDPRSLNADRVLDGIRRHCVTHVNVTPLYYRELVGRAAVRDPRLASVELLNLGGDVVRGSDIRRWRDGGFTARLTCCYGPTESTVTCTLLDTPDDFVSEDVVPIGRAVAGTRAYVLDGDLQAVPVGVPGELYLGGRRIATGYHDRPSATAENFLPDPFSDRAGARMYRTGDVVRRRADGVLEFRGRVDRQLKVRGHRVEPAEIEAALIAHPAVRAVAVVAREEELVAYVAADSDQGIREWLRDRLPAYLVPTAIVTLAELPLTPSGKLRHAELPAPPRTRPGSGAEVVEPRSVSESAVVEAFAAVLGIVGIGVHDDFFRLGGHSLAATRLVARLRDTAGVDLPVSTVFTGPTPAALAAEIDSAAVPAVVSIGRADRDAPLVLSAAQRRLWLLDRLDTSRQEYLVPMTYTIEGPLDVAALRRAADALVERHEILRTRYIGGEVLVQVVDEPGAVALDVVDADGRPVRQILADLTKDGFDLARDHQFRLVLVRSEPEHHVLLILTHHIACDGRSWQIVGDELARLYRGAELPPLAWQYADYAAWEHTQDLARGLDFWSTALSGITPLQLPADRPRPDVRDPSGSVCSFRVPGELVRLGQRDGATVFATWFALYSALLSRVSGQDDIVIGTPVSGRDHDGSDAPIGCFVNTMAVRVPEVSGSFLTHLGSVRALLIEAYEHRLVPFDDVVAELGANRDPARTPVFDVMFQVLEEAGPGLPLAGLSVQEVELTPRSAMVDLSLSLRPNPDGSWTGEFEYATALFDPATITRLSERFARLAAGVAERPEADLADIDLRSDAERDGRVAWHHDDPRPVMEIFAEQARKLPDAIAVVDPAGTVTYRELDERSNRLARHLIAGGVVAGSVVAVRVGRTAWTVVTLLAVLKCGAVYLPLDTAEPRHRIDALIAETAPVVVVTNEAFACDVPVIDVLRDATAIAERSSRRLTAPRADLAYVIFTSGSTGRPKGVLVDHTALSHHCQVMAGAYRLGPGERLALLASLSFDASMDQMLAPLVSGAAVVVLDARAVTPDRMLRDLHDHGVTVVDVTPVYFRELCRAARPRDPRLGGLRLMSVGGDVVTGEDAAAWHALGVPAEFGCTYGPTEATIACTFQLVDEREAERAGRGALPLGRALPGCGLSVLDSSARPVVPGAVGELYVGGGRVSRGYVNRPDLTADRFVPDPSGPPGARLYRTGDLVRMRPDGVVEFFGRADRQVKIRGFRIEPAEVETVLSACPGVRAAVVVPGPLPAGDQGLLGYVVVDTGTGTDAVRAYVHKRLPPHMVPAALTVIDKIPLTPNGKVAHARLPKPVFHDSRVDVRPMDPTEREVARIWGEVLGMTGIGPADDFFQLGGHSLSATRVSMRTQEAFGVELPLHRFFTATTVEALAAMIRGEVEAAFAGLSDAEVLALATENLEADQR
ncbi:non-ribosomal peptide synthetase [Amycolatopsis keratiniphila]|uniref:non-ribosomal peptide synthetase n=1 Tax=Amycolatopsis keratiniphila TaxID=129921 RepID=UPI0007ACE7AF|nr:non-ribosomal peptide synthetase [Amycolatopsis keratiniphila]